MTTGTSTYLTTLPLHAALPISLPGYLALLPLLPVVLAGWAPWLRRITWAFAACGLVVVLGYYAAVSVPSLRAQSAALKWYPSNFAGWDSLADVFRERLARMPEGAGRVDRTFKYVPRLDIALGEADIPVLDHQLHRAPPRP